MTDDLETPVDETADTSTPDEVDPSSETSTEEPQDVGALRRALDREREERRTAKEELRRIREDEDARSELLAEWGYEVADDTPDTDDDYEDAEEQEFRDPRVDQLLADQAAQRFEKDLTRFAGDRELSEFGREWIAQRTFNSGNNEKALKKAVEAWSEYEDGLVARGRESYRQTKKAPGVASKSGKAATQTPNWHDMSRDEQAERMADMIRDRGA